jgi:hypothetical protein
MGAFADVRTFVANALQTVIDANPEWSLCPLPVDALTPPAYVLTWADPWVPRALTHCAYAAQLGIRCVSARIDPDPGIELLETMVELALDALTTAGLPATYVSTPAPLELGGLNYQAAQILIVTTISSVEAP